MDRVRRRLTYLAAVALLAGAALSGACRPADAAAGRVVDRPARDVALAAFRAGIEEPAALTGGAASRDALIAAFVRALQSRDTAALVNLALNRAEFAWLYYPTNPQSLPPYDLSPGLMWFLHQGGSEKGLRRLLAARAGFDLRVVGARCDAGASHQGENTVVGPCVLWRLTAARDTVAERLFGLILERGGRYKFVSYTNKL